MRAIFIALAALFIAGCQVQEPATGGTVLSVEEEKQYLTDDLVKFDDDNLRFPEVAWQVEVELDNGSRVTTTHTGERRYLPGERVRVIVDGEDALLL